jgi:hypothetical protein
MILNHLPGWIEAFVSSGGPYAPARLSTRSLALPQQSAAPYIPPPINNSSGQINQLVSFFHLTGA